ncbi:hypothetical protein FRB94_008892 [Tulasnella sp. JGI-2019a]|nr:hypothetical protein FRB94_008892 [Tulasnella sp. JGI-2019a]KAG9000764.1 hypothetical protein FRB93_012590 [Tulasnella sp. JGI-2019a]
MADQQNTSGKTISVTLHDLAKMIDVSLLHPTMNDEAILDGLRQAKKYNMATACVKPYCIPIAVKELAGSTVLVCPVIGFPHGNSTTKVKVFEAIEAIEAGGREIDMVINVGKALSGEWDYVEDEIRQINEAVTKRGAILKVIFENDYLEDKHIIKLCEICSRIKPAFIKTSTGYGFVKQADGAYNYAGATLHHLKLMRDHVDAAVQIKAAGGVRTLDDLLRVRAIGVSRVGATAGPIMLEEAICRGIGESPKEVQVQIAGNLGGGY